jgi:hypothetical protein
MTIARCIPDLLRDGRLTPDQAKRAQELFDGHSAELAEHVAGGGRGGGDAADARRDGFRGAARSAGAAAAGQGQDFADAWLTRGGEHWGGGDRKGGGGWFGGGPARRRPGRAGQPQGGGR